MVRKTSKAQQLRKEIVPETIDAVQRGEIKAIEEIGRTKHNRKTEVTVFADGTTIVLEGIKACNGAKCKGRYRPMADFGYRKMKLPDGTEIIRTQPQCKECRGLKKEA
jgi:hypothetical protein